MNNGREDFMSRYCYICGYETTNKDITECPQCLCDDVFVNSKDEEELMILFDDRKLTNAMLELKKNNFVEYKLKLQQLKNAKEQQKQIEESSKKVDNTPKCPHCQSTNIKKISGLNRGASIAMLGIFSKKINKSYKCKHCGCTW